MIGGKIAQNYLFLEQNSRAVSRLFGRVLLRLKGGICLLVTYANKAIRTVGTPQFISRGPLIVRTTVEDGLFGAAAGSVSVVPRVLLEAVTEFPSERRTADSILFRRPGTTS